MALAMTIITNRGIHGALPRSLCLLCLTLMWLEAVLGVCLDASCTAPWSAEAGATDPSYEICPNGAAMSTP
jgi:hypothetical protein